MTAVQVESYVADLADRVGTLFLGELESVACAAMLVVLVDRFEHPRGAVRPDDVDAWLPLSRAIIAALLTAAQDAPRPIVGRA